MTSPMELRARVGTAAASTASDAKLDMAAKPGEMDHVSAGTHAASSVMSESVHAGGGERFHHPIMSAP
ncbi:uncharacterized protein PG998_011806 [Apiospora kogelbergensis]|uniref:uncharacterized protein n=1 Tax=Apiospora kogelbergensis TaxID=1337665 RepID=UPI0031322714